MKIGLVALTYVPGTAGGVETYFLDLLRNLQEIDRVNMYIVFAQPEALKQLEITAPNFKGVAVSESLLSKLARKLHLPVQLGFATQINRHKCDLYHFPFQVIVPSGVIGMKVLSFMDMQQEFFPEFFSRDDLAARRSAYKSSCEEADHIIAISNHTRQTLITRYQIPTLKVTTIYLAYNRKLFDGGTHKLTLELPQPYFYYPAATWPHKNHVRLLEAFASFHQKHPEYSLVLSGIKKQQGGLINEVIVRLKLQLSVIALGYLPYDQLPAIFEHAQALIFPSLFEGFGIPLLEAMASSCPVAASNVTSIPEVAGDAAIYFDPASVKSIEDAMVELAGSEELRDTLQTKGRCRVRSFSDRKMAEDTRALYESLGSRE